MTTSSGCLITLMIYRRRCQRTVAVENPSAALRSGVRQSGELRSRCWYICLGLILLTWTCELRALKVLQLHDKRERISACPRIYALQRLSMAAVELRRWQLIINTPLDVFAITWLLVWRRVARRGHGSLPLHAGRCTWRDGVAVTSEYCIRAATASTVSRSRVVMAELKTE